MAAHKGIVRWGLAVAAAGVLVLAGAAAALAQSRSGGPPDSAQDYSIRLVIEGRTYDGFVGVSGLSSETEVIEHRDGADPDLVHKIPGNTAYGDITLTRGLTGSDELWAWRQGIVEGDLERRDGSIIILDRQGSEVARYNFFDGWPSKWEGPSLDTGESGAVVESITITVARWEKE